MTELIHSLDGKSLGSLMQAAGYRVESVTDPSPALPFFVPATSGLSFDIRMGNRLPARPKPMPTSPWWRFSTSSANCRSRQSTLEQHSPLRPLQIDTSVPNAKFLVLCMGRGGWRRRNAAILRNQIEIWDGTGPAIRSWLRDELARLHVANIVTVDAAIAPSQTAGSAEKSDVAAVENA
ncbi:MAG: hypothetical protein WDN50_06365 [Bradyrhizobium sp.]